MDFRRKESLLIGSKEVNLVMDTGAAGEVDGRQPCLLSFNSKFQSVLIGRSGMKHNSVYKDWSERPKRDGDVWENGKNARKFVSQNLKNGRRNLA